MNLVWLGQPECHNSALTGGKAANLSRLAAAYPVPPGFCLTAAAFDRQTFCADNAELSESVREMLADAYRRLIEQCKSEWTGVAVRSSAADEDGQTASFAGQYETYLNVRGEEAVAQAVKQCISSACSERVKAYRRQQGLPTDKIRIAVLVQQLVAADVSAVVFSVNPVSGDSDEVIINANWGLGESIVGGTVTPDTYRVSKSDLVVIERQIARKQFMTVPVPGGTREVKVPVLLGKEPVITDIQAVEMARLAIALEHEMGWSVDIECAWKNEKLYLLQCRPVTTLKK
jgi:pyruvate, water dikinase